MHFSPTRTALKLEYADRTGIPGEESARPGSLVWGRQYALEHSERSPSNTSCTGNAVTLLLTFIRPRKLSAIRKRSHKFSR
jgi:hypothetical protein